LSLVREMRGGRLNDPRFTQRMRGQGAYAEMLGARFRHACRRLRLNEGAAPVLETRQFIGSPGRPQQGGLFDQT
jgi:hypothetical protein